MVGCNSVSRHCRAGRVFSVCCISDDREKHVRQSGRLRGCGNTRGGGNRKICLWSSVCTSRGGSFFVSGRGFYGCRDCGGYPVTSSCGVCFAAPGGYRVTGVIDHHLWLSQSIRG